MKDKLAIFDMDGTLYDTRDVNYQSYVHALAEFGYTLNKEDYFNKCNGKYYKDYLPLFIENPSNELLESIHQRKTVLYDQYLGDARENILLFHMAECMRSDFYLALVTTASNNCCKSILKYFHKESFFDLVITHNDITKVKPDPEGFLKAINYFDISPQKTIIFEDSEDGIKAGVCSGAEVIKIEKF